jgi:hypothetical protein
MNNRGPQIGTLWKVNSNALLACTLHEISREDITIRWYIFDDIIVLPFESTLLYVGEELLMASHWDLLNRSDYDTDEFFNTHEAAIFLFNDKKVYVFYDDHYNLWEPYTYLTEIKSV